MNIQELENEHDYIWINNPICSNYSYKKEHTKLSIQFAIEMLEECLENKQWEERAYDFAYTVDAIDLEDKIEELKKYL